MEKRKIIVHNVNTSLNSANLGAILRQLGSAHTNAEVILDKVTGTSIGTGIIEFASAEDMEKFLSGIYIIDGKQIDAEVLNSYETFK